MTGPSPRGDAAKHVCPTGARSLRFIETCDTWACLACDSWVEDGCDDPDCEFCTARPPHPSAMRQDPGGEEHDCR